MVLLLCGVLLAVTVVVISGVALIFNAVSGEPTIRDNSLLVLKVHGSLPDYVPEKPLRRFYGEDDPSLTELLTQLRKAKVDARIGAVLLEIDRPGVGWAKADEIREAVADFRTSGKPIYAHMEQGSNKEYYIATACEKIFVPPNGDLFITGLAAEVMFFRGSMDKLGIYPEVHKIGRYKNAPDQLTQKEMSEPHREVINSLLEDIFNRIIEATTRARHKSPEEVRALIDRLD
jgi:protease-4